MLKHVEKEWGGIEPTPFAYKHVENERGGVEPTPFVSKCMENERGEVELTPFGSKHVKNKRGGVEPTPFASKRVENKRGGLSLYEIGEAASKGEYSSGIYGYRVGPTSVDAEAWTLSHHGRNSSR